MGGLRVPNIHILGAERDFKIVTNVAFIDGGSIGRRESNDERIYVPLAGGLFALLFKCEK